jgi:hypothetical protein
MSPTTRRQILLETVDADAHTVTVQATTTRGRVYRRTYRYDGDEGFIALRGYPNTPRIPARISLLLDSQVSYGTMGQLGADGRFR